MVAGSAASQPAEVDALALMSAVSASSPVVDQLGDVLERAGWRRFDSFRRHPAL